MTAKRFQLTCLFIAQKLNRELSIRGHQLDAEKVAAVASGQNRSDSHPVLSAIERELRSAGIKIADAPVK